jgi:hypothetical protein
MSNTVINPYNFAVGGAGGWIELDRTTLGSSNDSILVSGLSNKMYYMVLCDLKQVTSNVRSSTRLNADTGSNYANRDSENGGADSTATSQTYMKNSGSNTFPMFNVQYLSNLLAQEKLSITSNVGQSSAGAGTAPTRMESVGKWANTSSVITSIEQYNDQAGSFDTGSEVVVLGYDPTDTHTSGGFWEELASVDLSGGVAPTLDSGVFTAKKYIWFQFYCDSIASNGVIRCTFNSDTGSNYANRINYNGTEDASNVNTAYAILAGSTYTTPFFVNMFVINNSANEKLITGNTIQQGAAGAGNAPAQRIEVADKWANTSSQITSIQIINNAAANFGTSTYLKVWGSD